MNTEDWKPLSLRKSSQILFGHHFIRFANPNQIWGPQAEKGSGIWENTQMHNHLFLPDITKAKEMEMNQLLQEAKTWMNLTNKMSGKKNQMQDLYNFMFE